MIREGKPIFALGAVEDGTALGALAGGPRNGEFEIVSFFVAREQRNRGAGTALLEELVRIAALQSELRQIRCSFENLTVEQERLVEFLKRHDFSDRTDTGNMLRILPEKPARQSENRE